MIARRTLVLGMGALVSAGRARAARPLVLLVGAPPGSNSDQLARAFAPFLERHLPGTRVEIRNVPGEAGLTAYRALAGATPSGDVLGWAGTPALPARVVDHSEIRLMDRLTLLGAVQQEPIAFVSPSSTPVDSAQELIRRSASAREAVPLATPPAGSPPHLAALQLAVVSATRLNIVAFPSSAAARQAVLAGNVAAAALALGDAIAGLRDGRLAGIGVASDGRSEAFPDLPSLHDLGLPVSATIRRGLTAPVGLPADLEARFAAAMQAVVADPEFLADGASDGFLGQWLAGADWTVIATKERETLTELWRAGPWLPTGAG